MPELADSGHVEPILTTAKKYGLLNLFVPSKLLTSTCRAFVKNIGLLRIVLR